MPMLDLMLKPLASFTGSNGIYLYAVFSLACFLRTFNGLTIDAFWMHFVTKKAAPKPTQRSA